MYLIRCLVAAVTVAAGAAAVVAELPKAEQSRPAEVVILDGPPVAENFGWLPPVEVSREVPAVVPIQSAAKLPAALQRKVTCGPGGCRVEFVGAPMTAKASCASGSCSRRFRR